MFLLENATFSNQLNFFSSNSNFDFSLQNFGCVGSCGYAPASVKYYHSQFLKNSLKIRMLKKNSRSSQIKSSLGMVVLMCEDFWLHLHTHHTYFPVPTYVHTQKKVQSK